MNFRFLYILVFCVLFTCCNKEQSNSTTLEIDQQNTPETAQIDNDFELILFKEKLKIFSWELSEETQFSYTRIPRISGITSLLPVLPNMSLQTRNSLDYHCRKFIKNPVGENYDGENGSLINLGIWAILNDELEVIDRAVAFARGHLKDYDLIVQPQPILSEAKLVELQSKINVLIKEQEDKVRANYTNIIMDVEQLDTLNCKKLREFYNQSSLLFGEIMKPTLKAKDKKRLEAIFSELGVNLSEHIYYALDVEIWMKVKHNKSIIEDLIIMLADDERMFKVTEMYRDEMLNY